MKTKFLALATLAALGSGSALAQKAGDWQVGAGWLHFAPQDSSKPLTFTSPIAAVVPGSGASVGTSDTLGLNLTYFIDSHWAVEGVMGVPPKFKLSGEGTLGPIGELGEAKFRPYVGLGATYVWYSDVKLTPGLQGALANRLGLPPSALSATTAKLDSSFTAVFNAGVAYQFDPHWGMAFSVSYIPLKTTAKLTTTARGFPVATSESSLKVNPIVPYLAVTYKF
jgi:outer membrane protein